MLHLELLPDDEGDRRLRQDWTLLEAAGLPNLSRHRSASHRPHVTVSLHPDAVAPDGVPPLAELARATGSLPLPLTPGALAVFGRGPWVLVRTLVVTEALLALHGAVSGVLGVSCHAHGRPGRWVPHTTVAHGLDADQVGRALTLLGRADAAAPEDSSAVLERARCWDSTRRRTVDVPRVDPAAEIGVRAVGGGAECRTSEGS